MNCFVHMRGQWWWAFDLLIQFFASTPGDLRLSSSTEDSLDFVGFPGCSLWDQTCVLHGVTLRGNLLRKCHACVAWCGAMLFTLSSLFRFPVCWFVFVKRSLLFSGGESAESKSQRGAKHWRRSVWLVTFHLSEWQWCSVSISGGSRTQHKTQVKKKTAAAVVVVADGERTKRQVSPSLMMFLQTMSLFTGVCCCAVCCVCTAHLKILFRLFWTDCLNQTFFQSQDPHWVSSTKLITSDIWVSLKIIFAG